MSKTVNLGASANAAEYPFQLPCGVEVLGRRGGGGMGDIFDARCPGLPNTPLIVKMLSLPGAGARFDREYAIQGGLSHCRIPRVVSKGSYFGRPYFVMEKVEARPLSERAPPLGVIEACKIIDGLLEVVEHVHDNGVIHRDLKPDNVLVDDRGRVWLIDFGIASSRRVPINPATETGDYFGTPRYMDPSVRPKHAGISGDIYAIGVIAYWLLTGQHPFEFIHQNVGDVIISSQIPPRLMAVMVAWLTRTHARHPRCAADARRMLRPWVRRRRATLVTSSAFAALGTAMWMLCVSDVEPERVERPAMVESQPHLGDAAEFFPVLPTIPHVRVETQPIVRAKPAARALRKPGSVVEPEPRREQKLTWDAPRIAVPPNFAEDLDAKRPQVLSASLHALER